MSVVRSYSRAGDLQFQATLTGVNAGPTTYLGGGVFLSVAGRFVYQWELDGQSAILQRSLRAFPVGAIATGLAVMPVNGAGGRSEAHEHDGSVLAVGLTEDEVSGSFTFQVGVLRLMDLSDWGKHTREIVNPVGGGPRLCPNGLFLYYLFSVNATPVQFHMGLAEYLPPFKFTRDWLFPAFSEDIEHDGAWFWTLTVGLVTQWEQEGRGQPVSVSQFNTGLTDAAGLACNGESLIVHSAT